MDKEDFILQPVYITLFYSDKNIANKVIRNFTKEEFSHAGISFDSSLEHIFSYNMLNMINFGGGFSFESLKYNQRNDKNTQLMVNVLFLKKNYVDEMKNYVNIYINNVKKTRYNFDHLIKILLNKKDENIYSYNQVCSEFTANVFKNIGIDLFDKSSNLVSPGDFINIKKYKSYNVYKGSTSEYNASIVDNKINRYIKNAKSIKESINNEDKLSSEERNNIKDNDFGLPSLRQYPLNDKNHVMKAIQLFNNCPEEHRKELANNIKKASKKYDINISNDNIINNYLNEDANNINNMIINELSKYDKDNIYVTSDWHLFKYQEDNIEEFIKKESDILKKDTLLIYLGDLGHRDNTSREKLLIKKIMSKIPCNKILVLGNHDKENCQYYKDCSFKYIVNKFILDDILFTHYPISIKKYSNINLNIHGHMHDDYNYTESEPENHINVYNKDRIPYKLSYILSNINKMQKNNIEIKSKDVLIKDLYKILNKYDNFNNLPLDNFNKVLSNKEFNNCKSGSHLDFSNDLYYILEKKYPNFDILNSYIEITKGRTIIKTYSIVFMSNDGKHYLMLDVNDNNRFIYKGRMGDMISRRTIELLGDIQESRKIGCKMSSYSYKPNKEYEGLSIEEYIDTIKKNALSQFSNMKLLNNTELEKANINESYVLEEASGNTKRKKIENLIYNTFSKLDKTGMNTKKYKELFGKMSDSEFDTYMKRFLKDTKQNFYLEIIPNKIDPKLTDIVEALNYLGVPAEEYVYFKDEADGSRTRTRYRVPVGYLNIKRTQQLLSKKNTYSLDISQRSAKLNQATGDDKIA